MRPFNWGANNEFSHAHKMTGSHEWKNEVIREFD